MNGLDQVTDELFTLVLEDLLDLLFLQFRVGLRDGQGAGKLLDEGDLLLHNTLEAWWAHLLLHPACDCFR